MMRRGRLIILLVEDQEEDVFFVRRATEARGAGDQVYAVRDGEEAILYLQGQGQYADRSKFPFPNVILTDLKMPGMNGLEFLQWLQLHPECSVIPVMMYSSSNHPEDVRRAYRYGANGYILKPATQKELVELLRVIFEFWSHCELPPLEGRC